MLDVGCLLVAPAFGRTSPEAQWCPLATEIRATFKTRVRRRAGAPARPPCIRPLARDTPWRHRPCPSSASGSWRRRCDASVTGSGTLAVEADSRGEPEEQICWLAMDGLAPCSQADARPEAWRCAAVNQPRQRRSCDVHDAASLGEKVRELISHHVSFLALLPSAATSTLCADTAKGAIACQNT